MSHSSSRWHETSISSVIPKPIVDRRKQSPSDITILIIHTSLSPSFYSPENWRRAPEIYRLFTPWKRWSLGEIVEVALPLADGLGIEAQDLGEVLDPPVAELGRLDGGVPAAIVLAQGPGEGSHGLFDIAGVGGPGGGGTPSRGSGRR